MDPLTALRDYTIRGELDNITRVSDEFHFSNQYTFPCKLETPYRSKQGNLYTLETLVFFIQNRNARQSEYIKSATNLALPTVTFVDRKPLLDYLEGRSASSDAIQFPVPNANANPNPNFVEDDHVYRLDDADDGLGVDVDVDKEKDDVIGLIREIERPLRDRNVILQCRNRDFYHIYNTAVKREEEKKKDVSLQRKETGKGRGSERDERPGKMMKLGGVVVGGGGGGKKGKGEGVPIILVPSASNTLITIYNVKEFLEDGVFIPTDVKMKQMNGLKPECVTVQKKFSRDKDKVMAAYEVRDKPSTMKENDWARVVAVFVLGKEWQFKDWRNGGFNFKDHVDIFNKGEFRLSLGFF